jgi:hypothetical protein
MHYAELESIFIIREFIKIVMTAANLFRFHTGVCGQTDAKGILCKSEAHACPELLSNGTGKLCTCRLDGGGGGAMIKGVQQQYCKIISHVLTNNEYNAKHTCQQYSEWYWI